MRTLSVKRGLSPNLPVVELRINAEGEASDLIVPHDQYRGLGRNAEARREAYRALFRALLDDIIVNDIRLTTNGGFVLGRARFAEEIAWCSVGG